MYSKPSTSDFFLYFVVNRKYKSYYAIFNQCTLYLALISQVIPKLNQTNFSSKNRVCKNMALN